MITCTCGWCGPTSELIPVNENELTYVCPNCGTENWHSTGLSCIPFIAGMLLSAVISLFLALIVGTLVQDVVCGAVVFVVVLSIYGIVMAHLFGN